MVALVQLTQIFDAAAEGPFKNGQLDDTGPDGRDQLAKEHSLRWDLKIVA